VNRRRLSPIMAVLLTLTTAMASPAFAGSSEPNPEALVKAVKEQLRDQQVVDREAAALRNRIANDPDFAKAFDYAVYRQDRPRILELIKEAGVRQSAVSILGIDPDFKITIQFDWKKGTLTIQFEW